MHRTNLEGSGDPVSCSGCGRICPGSDLVLLQQRRLCAACKHRTLSRHFAVRPTLLPAATGAAAPLGSDCSAHEGESAFAICERCGDFMCPLCTTPYEGRFYCAACFDLLWTRHGLAPERSAHVPAWVTLLLAAVALVGSWVPFLNMVIVAVALVVCLCILVDRTHPQRSLALASLAMTFIALLLSVMALAQLFT